MPSRPARVLKGVDLTFLAALSPLLFTGLSGSMTTTGAWSSGDAFYHEYTVSTIHACTQIQTCFLSPSLNTHSYKCTPESRGNKTMRPTHIQVHAHAHYLPARVLERVDLTFLVHVALSPLLFTGLLGSTTTTGAWSSGAAFYSQCNTCMYTIQTCLSLSLSLNTHSYKCTPESRSTTTIKPTHIQVHAHAHYSPACVLDRVDLTFLVHVALSPLLFTGLLGSTTTTGAWSSGAAFYWCNNMHVHNTILPSFHVIIQQ